MMRPSQGRGLDSPGGDRTSRPIDLMHLARQTLGDDGLAGEVLRMFEQQVTRYFERVRTSNDEFEITLGLHTLKGAAQGVGAMALAAQARAAETEFANILHRSCGTEPIFGKHWPKNVCTCGQSSVKLPLCWHPCARPCGVLYPGHLT